MGQGKIHDGRESSLIAIEDLNSEPCCSIIQEYIRTAICGIECGEYKNRNDDVCTYLTTMIQDLTAKALAAKEFVEVKVLGFLQCHVCQRLGEGDGCCEGGVAEMDVDMGGPAVDAHGLVLVKDAQTLLANFAPVSTSVANRLTAVLGRAVARATTVGELQTQVAQLMTQGISGAVIDDGIPGAFSVPDVRCYDRMWRNVRQLASPGPQVTPQAALFQLYELPRPPRCVRSETGPWFV